MSLSSISGQLTTPNIPTRKNFIINGNFNIWQRGTTLTFAGGTSGYIADRFQTNNATDGTVVVSQEAAVLPTVAQAGVKSLYSQKIACTTADATIAAGQFAFNTQIVEGYNVQSLMGRVVTLSFWVRSSKTGIYTISFLNGGADRTYVAEYTILAANTWEKKTITLTMLDGTAGTWYFDNRVGLYVVWGLACGSTYQTTANAWQTGQFLGSANQVDWLDSDTATFYMSQVQLELGGVATDFERPLAQAELAQCLRYCYVIASNATNTNPIFGQGLASTTTNAYIQIPLPVQMRAAPSLGALTAGDFRVFDGVTATNATALALSGAAAQQSAPTLINIQITVAAGLTTNRAYFGQFTNQPKTLIITAEI